MTARKSRLSRRQIVSFPQTSTTNVLNPDAMSDFSVFKSSGWNVNCQGPFPFAVSLPNRDSDRRKSSYRAPGYRLH